MITRIGYNGMVSYKIIASTKVFFNQTDLSSISAASFSIPEVGFFAPEVVVFVWIVREG
jgi:hypothetical protein